MSNEVASLLSYSSRKDRELRERFDLIAERSILSALLVSHWQARLLTMLTPDDFRDERCRLIFSAIYRLVFESGHGGIKVDVLTISDELTRSGDFDKVGARFLGSIATPYVENLKR